MSTYAIINERADDGGYGAWSPDVPGCVALGDTEAEALSEMKDAIRLHLDEPIAAYPAGVHVIDPATDDQLLAVRSRSTLVSQAQPA